MGRAGQLCPGSSDVDLPRYSESVVDLNAEITHGALGHRRQSCGSQSEVLVKRVLTPVKKRQKADSSLGACSNLSAFTWANCERRSGGARQREGSSEKHGNTYALRQRLFNNSLGERPICT
jgi:hypothetical protein